MSCFLTSCSDLPYLLLSANFSHLFVFAVVFFFTHDCAYSILQVLPMVACSILLVLTYDFDCFITPLLPLPCCAIQLVCAPLWSHHFIHIKSSFDFLKMKVASLPPPTLSLLISLLYSVTSHKTLTVIKSSFRTHKIIFSLFLKMKGAGSSQTLVTNFPWMQRHISKDYH